MNEFEIIRHILAEKKTVTDVFFVACGGSLVDLYPAKYFIEKEAREVHAACFTSNEFVSAPPRVLGNRSLAILCSHGGNTAETIAAGQLAREKGAAVITLTHTAGSGIEGISDYKIVYQWGDAAPVSRQPMAICLALVNALLSEQEGFAHQAELDAALTQIDAIVNNALRLARPRTVVFARKYQAEPILYILSSGAAWAQAYGFAICSLMEMQWMHASYIHSGEYFHGPFEVTDRNVPYILLMNLGKTRNLDERVLQFLQRYTEKIEVVDAQEYGLGAIDQAVVDYFNPILFYSVMNEYRSALARLRNHPLETRRYMGVVPY